MSEAIRDLLNQLEIHPVLLDIGASGTPPRIWDEIAPYSLYVGFDPDRREIQDIREGRFYRSIIINEAITSDGGDEAAFYLTASPYCSSTLRPDDRSLSDYLFSDLFVVEREVKVRATSLDAVVDRQSLSGVDWFKTDSQGTDLRLFNSLRSDVRSRVLAVDIEPGLIDAYVGEDLFVDAHRTLTRNGFWLSNVTVCGAVRMRRRSIEAAKAFDSKIDAAFVQAVVRESPGWCEARYLRTLDWLGDNHLAARDYALLWVFALLDNQLGFALDLGLQYQNIFGSNAIADLLQREPVSLMRQEYTSRHVSARRLVSRARRRLGRIWRSLTGSQ